MTEKSASDVLREKLTERGVEYTTNDHMGAFETSWNGFTAMQLTPSAKLIMVVTPEQAITATLGSDAKPCYATDYTHDHCKYSVNRGWVEDTRFFIPTAKLGNGTLTAEQVSEAIEKRFEFDVWVPPERWQAIADELNAAMGDDDYELRMDELLCRLTNGKWSKSRSYSVDFMVSCVDEAYEDATLGDDEKLLDLAHNAWSIAVCAMQNTPIPASWGDAVEKGLRERGIDVDELPYVVPDAALGGGTCEWVWVESWTDTTDGRECDYAHWMPDCGCWSEYDHRFSDFDDYTEKPTDIAFCERCGKAVKR